MTLSMDYNAGNYLALFGYLGENNIHAGYR